MNITADSIATALTAAQSRGLPPVDQWNPPFCGDIDMRIARDGTWHYLGSPIGRIKLVRLFSTVLKREGDAYFLVTPVEKVGITVDDVPFVAVDFERKGSGKSQALHFTTSLGDSATANADHPLRFDRTMDDPAPYIEIRAGLDARIDRKSFYRLVDLAVEETLDGVPHVGLWSGNKFFPMARREALE